MITEIAFVVYPIKDVRSARAFYEEILGLRVETNFGDSWIEYDIGGGTFAITTMDEKHVAGANGAVIAFEVDDLDAMIEGLRRKGVKSLGEPITTSVCRFVTLTDPDGNEVIIHRRNP